MPIKIAILVSGRGSNLEAILQAIRDGKLEAQVEAVISNNPEALALQIARKFGVHAVAVDHRGIKRAEHEKRVLQELSFNPVDYIVLAGYMRILSPEFLRHFKDSAGYFRVVNIHPSILPAFPGADAYADAFESGVAESGVTIHLVDEQVDHGPILAQERFPRLQDDTLESFKARGLSIEHRLYPTVLQRIAKEGIVLSSPEGATP